MFTARVQLFRLAGIPIRLDASWLVILALLTWTLTEQVFLPELPEAAWYTHWILGLATAVAFFICIVLHELGHALVARASGMQIRGITLFLFGGVAELGGEPPSAGAEFLMAAAGPGVSAVLATLFWAMSAFVTHASGWLWADLMLRNLALINITVLLLNLIPAFPLDGGRIFRSALWGILGDVRRATYWAALGGQAFAWILIAIGILRFIYGDFIGGLWMGLIGLFLNNAARGSYQQVLIREMLQGEPVSRFMHTEPIVVPPSLDLRHWVEDYVYRYHRKAFPVASNGHLEGFISTQALGQYPRDDWEKHTVGEVMRHDLEKVSIPPNADALQAMSKMQQTGLSRLLVTDGDRLLGIISLKDLLRFLHLKVDLERGGETD
jgi:Zn-dependent protease/CBS domain-containing protein